MRSRAARASGIPANSCASSSSRDSAWSDAALVVPFAMNQEGPGTTSLCGLGFCRGSLLGNLRSPSFDKIRRFCDVHHGPLFVSCSLSPLSLSLCPSLFLYFSPSLLLSVCFSPSLLLSFCLSHCVSSSLSLVLCYSLAFLLSHNVISVITYQSFVVTYHNSSDLIVTSPKNKKHN